MIFLNTRLQKYNRITGIIKINFDTEILNDKKLRPRKITSRLMLNYGADICILKQKAITRIRASVNSFLETTTRLHCITPPNNSDIGERLKVTNIIEDVQG
jgi:hypothetical protein